MTFKLSTQKILNINWSYVFIYLISNSDNFKEKLSNEYKFNI